MDGNATHHIASFFLVGIPGLESFHCWIGIPICLLFVLTLLGNSIIITTVKLEPRLHQPMDFFLCMLAMNDMCLTCSAALQMLAIFWFGAHWINFDACLTQMFFHSHTLHHGVCYPSAMAFDRFVAICLPLSYTSTLTTPMVIKIGLVGLSRATLMIMPCPPFIKRLLYYTKYVIHHAYCEHMAVVKVASANTYVNRIYGILVALSVAVFDLGLIASSYIKILQAVFRLSSQRARSKALGTCAAHVCTILAFYTPALFSLGHLCTCEAHVCTILAFYTPALFSLGHLCTCETHVCTILAFYTPVLFSFLTHRFGKNVPPSVHIMFAILYLPVTPTANPLVYGVKTKEIHDRVLGLLLLKKKISEY